MPRKIKIGAGRMNSSAERRGVRSYYFSRAQRMTSARVGFLPYMNMPTR